MSVSPSQLFLWIELGSVRRRRPRCCYWFGLEWQWRRDSFLLSLPAVAGSAESGASANAGIRKAPYRTKALFMFYVDQVYVHVRVCGDVAYIFVEIIKFPPPTPSYSLS